MLLQVLDHNLRVVVPVCDCVEPVLIRVFFQSGPYWLQQQYIDLLLLNRFCSILLALIEFN